MAVSPTVSVSRADTLAQLAAHRAALHEVIRTVANAEVGLAEIFSRARSADIGNAVRDVYVVKLAEALPQVGKVRARRVLAEFGLGERTRVYEVPQEVQAALCEALA